MHENIFNLSMRLICVYKVVSKEKQTKKKTKRVAAVTNQQKIKKIHKTIKHLILLIALKQEKKSQRNRETF